MNIICPFRTWPYSCIWLCNIPYPGFTGLNDISYIYIYIYIYIYMSLSSLYFHYFLPLFSNIPQADHKRLTYSITDSHDKCPLSLSLSLWCETWFFLPLHIPVYKSTHQQEKQWLHALVRPITSSFSLHQYACALQRRRNKAGSLERAFTEPLSTSWNEEGTLFRNGNMSSAHVSNNPNPVLKFLFPIIYLPVVPTATTFHHSPP